MGLFSWKQYIYMQIDTCIIKMHAIQTLTHNPMKPLIFMHHVFYAEQLLSLLANKDRGVLQWAGLYFYYTPRPFVECLHNLL